MEKSFKLNSSLIQRLKVIFLAIAVFFIISFFSIYISSMGFLKGLKDINNANIIFNLTTQSLEVLENSSNNLEKLLRSSNLKDSKFAFSENLKFMDDSLKEAKVLTENSELQRLLKQAVISLRAYEESASILFSKISKSKALKLAINEEDLRPDFLMSMQYAVESKEFLRKFQIELRKESDEQFLAIFENRFRPLIVATVLSLFFFSFVVTFGFGIAGQLNQSIKNLTKATETVATGDLAHEAPILFEDEIGNLTFAFNNMVHALKLGRNELDLALNRIRNLQQVTASFSEALTAEQVSDISVKFSSHALSAKTGVIALFSSAKDHLEIKGRIGFTDEDFVQWKSIPLSKDVPIVRCVKTLRPVFIDNPEQLKESFPDYYETFTENGASAIVSIPLLVGDTVLGALSFSFEKERTFLPEEREFILALSRQCAQALHRSQLYDEAKSAIIVRDEFLSIASHELKTPLTPLKLQLQLIARKLARNGGNNIEPEKLIKMVETSDRQLNRLAKLIEDLLDVSRITSGKLTLNRERVNLSELLNEVMEQYGQQLKKALGYIKVENEDNLFGEYDRIRIEQVLINLLTNSAKYAEGKPILLAVKRVGDCARFMVADQGPGISDLDQERIFDRFERVKNSNNIGGLGLGLYISKQIIEAHYGKIWVESESGKGAKFFFELPLT